MIQMFRCIAAFLALLICSPIFSQQLMINEVSQGPGSSEYVEFVVAGNATCISPVPCLDLRKVIIDDNNGYFASGSGTGIAGGAVRFANIPFWQCVPQGTIILIYNEGSTNPGIPSDDSSLSDGNCLLVLPSTSTLLEKTTVSPTTTNSSYPPDASWVTGGSWNPLAMSNTDDSFQLPNILTGIPNHSVSWGNNTNGAGIYFSGSAAGKVFSFVNTVSNVWTSQANWASGDIFVNETPGYPNNAANIAWIGAMNPQCAPNPFDVTLSSVGETCVNACDGSALATPVNGQAPYTYLWSNGSSASSIANVCPGVYSVEVTTANGCSLTETVTISAGSAQANASINAAGPFTNTDLTQQIVAVNSGGNWTADCGTCLSASGVFNPQIAGIGSWNICYSLGEGACADQDCITVLVTEGCTPQITNETRNICPGDSSLIFGNWETIEGQFSMGYTDISGCDSTHIINLAIYVAEDIFETRTLCEFDSSFVFNQWIFNDGLYSQQEQTAEGCFYNHTIEVVIQNCIIEPPVIFIPNVFTPNNDLINDTFAIVFQGGMIEEGYIFNRWGNLVHTFGPNDITWDGIDSKSGQDVQDGVYTYLVYFKPAYSGREEYHGFVTVIR
jgi:gliding motility-associated-like protein